MQQSINQGLRLGIVLLVLFTFSAVAIFLIAGAAGNDGSGQLVLALCLGPLLGSVLFGVWWKFRVQDVRELQKHDR